MKNNIKKIVIKKLFQILQKYVLNTITNKLGKIELTDDKIICYVDNKRLKKFKKGRYLTTYELMFRPKKIWPEKTLNAYKVNKPVYYVIRNMDFEEPLLVMASENSNIIFSNCKFNMEINISSGGDVILENNQYCDDCGFYRNSVSFARISAKTLKFVNDNFVNRGTYNSDTKFGMMIDTDNLEIINSNFDIKNNDGIISIRSKNVDIKDSDINCYKDIYIKSDEIRTDNSLIKSRTGINIENKNNNKLLGFNSPKTIYNGVDLSKYNTITPQNLELQKSRISLVEKLRQVRDSCININLNELKELESSLNQRSVIKTIKNAKK